MVDEPGVTRDRLYGRSFWGEHEFMVVDTGGVVTVSKSQANVMEDLAISTTIGMDGIPLASREAAVARMPSMIEKQATAAVEESSVIIFLVDGQVQHSLSLFVFFFSDKKQMKKERKCGCEGRCIYSLVFLINKFSFLFPQNVLKKQFIERRIRH